MRGEILDHETHGNYKGVTRLVISVIMRMWTRY